MQQVKRTKLNPLKERRWLLAIYTSSHVLQQAGRWVKKEKSIFK